MSSLFVAVGVPSSELVDAAGLYVEVDVGSRKPDAGVGVVGWGSLEVGRRRWKWRARCRMLDVGSAVPVDAGGRTVKVEKWR